MIKLVTIDQDPFGGMLDSVLYLLTSSEFDKFPKWSM